MLKKKIKEIIENYKDLPKSINDDSEFVIIAEKDEGGSYEEYKECLGVTEDGKLIWCYLSGCSCNGMNSNDVISDVTAKVFSIEKDENAESFFERNKVEPYATSYSSY